MTARLAIHVPPQQLPELQRAARLLLRTPLVTSADPDAFRLVRRWETVLDNEFSQRLGWRLDLTRSAARLLRRPVTLGPHRPARLATGRPLGRWAYVYLALALGALEQPGSQVLADELWDRIARLARGDERLQLDRTEHAQRRAFRDAVRYLEELGVLRVRDGDVEELLNDGQVLWDVDRDAAGLCLVVAPSILRSVRTVEDFVAESLPTGIDDRRRRARRLLNRRILTQPLVRLADLDDDEAELAWRNRRREADNLARLTGCAIELRREGVALVDHPSDPIGRRFPSGDSVAHAALLWLTELLDIARPTRLDADEPTVAAVVARADADSAWERVVDAYAERFTRDARERRERFRADVDELLDRLCLVSEHPDGVEVTAFAARYRAEAILVENDAAEADMQGALF